MTSELLGSRGPATIADRLVAARVAHRDAQEVAGRCAATFRALICEAIDSGMRQDDVAALAGVSRARVHHVIAREYSQP